MSLSNLKAKRTRYKNILQQYLTTGKNLLAVQTGSIDLDSFVEEIEKSSEISTNSQINWMLHVLIYRLRREIRIVMKTMNNL